jgi:hypothetical protein
MRSVRAGLCMRARLTRCAASLPTAQEQLIEAMQGRWPKGAEDVELQRYGSGAARMRRVSPQATLHEVRGGWALTPGTRSQTLLPGEPRLATVHSLLPQTCLRRCRLVGS